MKIRKKVQKKENEIKKSRKKKRLENNKDREIKLKGKRR